MRDIISDLENGIFLSDPDPVRRAQIQMRAPLPKRFYEKASVMPAEGGFGVALDGKLARTPGRMPVILPTQKAAQLVADEFEAQTAEIVPVTMPVLRLVNTALDGVAQNPQAVADDVAQFAGSDLLCYRAEGPEALQARQSAAWDPVLDWAERRLGARFLLAEGIMPVTQPPRAIDAVRAHLADRLEPQRLAAIHLLTTLMGSALLALAVEDRALSPDEAWAAAHVDENWNAEQWGHDSEALARFHARERDMRAAAALLGALER
ncbi:MAG: ATPase [Mesorhizobium amorphae]|nr:MAG: ATPase [Mesorhizobium amorphae]